VPYPEAELIVRVMDNLNPHRLGALYEAFAPAEAARTARKLQIHDTPKHGSWLNMAESELSILARPCLNRRIAYFEGLRPAVAAWEDRRNRAQTRMPWRFTPGGCAHPPGSALPIIRTVTDP
jgi:transposase